jgi:DNA-binding SARP family transcriptional activator/tetratricopeptide (TPR) repeat protein
MSGVEIDLLGKFEVRIEGRTVDDPEYGGRRVRQLIRMLAAQRGHLAPRDALIESLWGDQLPTDPATNLNVIVNRARKALGGSDAIRTVADGYLLRAGPDVVVDAERFEALGRSAGDLHGEGESAAALAAARAALDAWGEPFPHDAYADWAQPHRDRLERLHQDLLEIAAETSVAEGDARAAVALAAEAVALQPLREAAHLLLMRAYAADGDQAAAVTSYLDLRRVLADELGIDPSVEATDLYEQLLRGSATKRSGRTRRRPTLEAPPFVGRERELDLLTALGNDGRVAVVAGRSGLGKSRLLESLSATSDRPVLFARALMPERDEAYGLVRTLLQTAPVLALDIAGQLSATTQAALGNLLLDGEAAPTANADARSQRALIRQGVLRVIEATAPALVLVDDLQWADSSSLDVLALLVGRSADVVLVVAYRPDEVDEDSPVARLLATLSNASPVELELRPFDTTALRSLVESDELAAALAEHTDRTPFAVLQVARALERDALLRRGPSGSWQVIGAPATDRVRELARAGQEATVWRQFERQPPQARELLAFLALLGRPVPARLLASAGGVAPDVVLSELRGLARSHLVSHVAEGFRTAHDVVGESIRARLDPVERARFHHRIAAALTKTDGPADELARHLHSAGDTAAAAEAYAAAASARIDRLADDEAHQLACEGLALEPSGDVRRTLLEVRAETSFVQGDLASARADLRAALMGASPKGVRARLLARLAQLTAGAEDLTRAAELADLALAEAGPDPAARAKALYVRALVGMNSELRTVSEGRFDEALALFTEIGDSGGMADILDARAMSAFGSGEVTAGIAQLDRVANLFTDSGNLLRVVTPRSTCGHGLWFAGRAHEGLAHTSAALELARTLGYAEGEAMVLWQHAGVLVGCGRPNEGIAAASQGVDLAKRIGHRGWTACTLRALGVARAAVGDLSGAAAALDESVSTSGEHLSMFTSWSQAHLTLVLLAQGRIDEAADLVSRALGTTPAIDQYDVRLARCEVAAARGDHDALELVDEALRLARAGGHLLSAGRLEELRGQGLRGA